MTVERADVTLAVTVDGYKRMNGRVIDGEDTYDISGQFSQMTLDENIQLERYA